MKSIFLKTLLLLTAVLLLAATNAQAQKLKLGSSIKLSPIFYLPIMAAEEMGFWRENGLDVEWVPFAGSAPMFSAAASRALNVGLTDAPSLVLAAGRGVPVIGVSDLQSAELFVLWVRADRNVKELKDLKGATIGVPRFGGVSHAYGQIVGKKLGRDANVKVVAVGGIPEIVAALKTGVIDATIEPTHLVIALKIQGVIKEVVPMAELLPKEWAGHWVFAHKDYIKSDEGTVRRLVKAHLQSTNYIRNNPRWAIEKMVAVSGFSEEGARAIFAGYQFPGDGKVSPRGVENLKNFLVEYGLLVKEKVPPVQELFSSDFVR